MTMRMGMSDDVWHRTFNHDSNPMDDHGHGTHTAGTFGAVGNNGPDYLTGTATVGVNWTVSILACKFLDAAGNGSDAGAIECLNYITALKNRGVNIRVSNNSWGSERGAAPFPQVLKDAFDAAGNAGILNVAAAGNGAPTRSATTSIAFRSTPPVSPRPASSRWRRRIVMTGAPASAISASRRWTWPRRASRFPARGSAPTTAASGRHAATTS